jgi:hypothetical protein
MGLSCCLQGHRLHARLIMDLKSMRAAQRQSSAVCLGSVQYARYPRGVERAVDALMVQLGTGTKVGHRCAR